MTEVHVQRLGWLSNLWGMLPSAPDVLIEITARTEETDVHIETDFGDLKGARVSIGLGSTDAGTSWPDKMGETFGRDEYDCLFLHAVADLRPARWSSGTMTEWRGHSALLAAALEGLPAGKTLCCLLPLNVMTTQQSSQIRAELAARKCVHWIAFLGESAATALGVHALFPMVILVIRLPTKEETQVLRLVDLRDSPQSTWARCIARTARRGGGEAESAIVLRDPGLDDGPWTFERFSRQLAEVLDDLSHVGELRSLSDFISNLQCGQPPKFHHGSIIPVEDSDVAPAHGVPCYSGRSISSDGGLGGPASWLKDDSVSEALQLQAGDVLIRALVGSAPTVVCAVADDSLLPATFDHTLIRLSWKRELAPEARELLQSHLVSPQAIEWIRSQGIGMRLMPSMLGRLPVPEPSPEVVAALHGLTAAEQTYRAWAEDVRRERQHFFSCDSFREAVPAIIRRTRMEAERLSAAEDALTFDYRVRNSFPHPIALRRQNLLEEDFTSKRLQGTLECAEHLVILVALLAIQQMNSEGNSAPLPIPRRFADSATVSSFVMDWGKCMAVIRDGIAFTRRNSDPLSLPFPSFLNLEGPESGEKTPWTIAEDQLRNDRNRRAHLERLPATEIAEKCRQSHKHLEDLLQGVEFLASTPLVYVEDYKLLPGSSGRTATFQYLQGISTAFKRSRLEVAQEIPREIVGVLTAQGEFRTLYPWVRRELCSVCKRPEVFVFNRYENGEASYVAMESGHAHMGSETNTLWAGMLRDAKEPASDTGIEGPKRGGRHDDRSRL